MKVVSAESRVEVVEPTGTGPRAGINLEVVNTSSVIDAVTVEAHGPTAPYVVVSPTPLVTCFVRRPPQSSRQRWPV